MSKEDLILIITRKYDCLKCVNYKTQGFIRVCQKGHSMSSHSTHISGVWQHEVEFCPYISGYFPKEDRMRYMVYKRIEFSDNNYPHKSIPCSDYKTADPRPNWPEMN